MGVIRTLLGIPSRPARCAAPYCDELAHYVVDGMPYCIDHKYDAEKVYEAKLLSQANPGTCLGCRYRSSIWGVVRCDLHKNDATKRCKDFELPEVPAFPSY